MYKWPLRPAPPGDLLMQSLPPNMVRKILILAAQRKLKPTHPLVVQEVMAHFNFSPTPNDNFNKPVEELAESCESSQLVRIWLFQPLPWSHNTNWWHLMAAQWMQSSNKSQWSSGWCVMISHSSPTGGHWPQWPFWYFCIFSRAKATSIVSMCLPVTCDPERPPPPVGKFAGRSRSLRTFLVLRDPPPLAGKFAGRCRSEVKRNVNFVRVFGLGKFSADGNPPPLSGIFDGRCRSEVKKIQFC